MGSLVAAAAPSVLGAVAGQVAGKFLGGGGSGGGQALSQEAINAAQQYASQATFKPYTVTTGAGTSGFDGGNFYSQLSQPLANYQQQTFGAVNQFLPQLTGLAGQAPAQFNYQSPLFGQAQQLARQAPQQFAFTPDIGGRQQEIFQQTSAQLQPQFAQQATQLQQDLFSSGRLGLRLAGESAGLGAGSGMVQPDALGLGRAQQQTLANLATQARQQALGEEAQRYQQSLGTFGTNIAQQQQQLQNLLGTQSQGFGQAAQGFGLNQAQQQQQFANLMGLQQGLFGQGINLATLENQLLAQGVDAQTAQAAAAYAAGNLALSPYSAGINAASQAQGNQMNLVGGIAGGLLSNPGLFGQRSTGSAFPTLFNKGATLSGARYGTTPFSQQSRMLADQEF